ncbi:hypothetical protein D3C80_1079830 [compost metagenome]
MPVAVVTLAPAGGVQQALGALRVVGQLVGLGLEVRRGHVIHPGHHRELGVVYGVGVAGAVDCFLQGQAHLAVAQQAVVAGVGVEVERRAWQRAALDGRAFCLEQLQVNFGKRVAWPEDVGLALQEQAVAHAFFGDVADFHAVQVGGAGVFDVGGGPGIIRPLDQACADFRGVVLQDERASADDLAQRTLLSSERVGGRSEDGQVGGGRGLQEAGVGP